MLSSRVNTIKSSIATLATVCVFAILFTSVFFVTFHHNHDCIGESCIVCLQIELCAKSLEKLFSLGLFVLVFCFYLVSSKLSKRDPLRFRIKRSLTLINTNVQLNN